MFVLCDVLMNACISLSPSINSHRKKNICDNTDRGINWIEIHLPSVSPSFSEDVSGMAEI